MHTVSAPWILFYLSKARGLWCLVNSPSETKIRQPWKILRTKGAYGLFPFLSVEKFESLLRRPNTEECSEIWRLDISTGFMSAIIHVRGCPNSPGQYGFYRGEKAHLRRTKWIRKNRTFIPPISLVLISTALYSDAPPHELRKIHIVLKFD